MLGFTSYTTKTVVFDRSSDEIGDPILVANGASADRGYQQVTQSMADRSTKRLPVHLQLLCDWQAHQQIVAIKNLTVRHHLGLNALKLQQFLAKIASWKYHNLQNRSQLSLWLGSCACKLTQGAEKSLIRRRSVAVIRRGYQERAVRQA